MSSVEQRDFSWFSPNWLLTRPDDVRKRLQKEAEDIGSPPPTNHHYALILIERIEAKPRLLDNLPALRLASDEYRAAVARLREAARSGETLSRLANDIAFLKEFLDVVGGSPFGLVTILTNHFDTLYTHQYLGARDVEFLMNPWLQALEECLNELPANKFTLARTLNVVTITPEGALSKWQVLYELYQMGCQPLTMRVEEGRASIQTISRTRSQPGFYQYTSEGFVAWEHSEVFYKAARLGHIPMASFLGWNDQSLASYQSSPHVLFRGVRTPRTSGARINNWNEFYTQSQRGIKLSSEALSAAQPLLQRLLPNVGMEISVERLSQINEQLVNYPSYLSSADWYSALVKLLSATIDQPLAYKHYEAIVQQSDVNTIFRWPLLYGSFLETLFILTHTYVPKTFFFRDRGFRHSLLQRLLAKRLVVKGGEYYEHSQTQPLYQQFLTIVLKVQHRMISHETLFRHTQTIYNPRRPALRALELRGLVFNHLNGDLHYAHFLEHLLSDDRNRQILEEHICRVPEYIMINHTKVWATPKSWSYLLLDQTAPFITMPQFRRCLNSSTFVDLIDTAPEPDLSSDFSEQVFSSDILLGFGKLDQYVCLTIDEVIDALDRALTSTDVGEALIWKLDMPREITDSSGRRHPNPYNSNGRCIPEEHYPILETYFWWAGHWDARGKVGELSRRRQERGITDDLADFIEQYKALDNKAPIRAYLTLLNYLALYGRRWRGPGFKYPLLAAHTNITASPNIAFAQIAGQMLTLYNNANETVRRVLNKITGYSYNYARPPIFMARTEPLHNSICKTLGIDLSGRITGAPQCLRMVTQNTIFGAALRYSQALNLTIPEFDPQEAEIMGLVDERDAGGALPGLEPGRQVPTLQYGDVFKQGIELYILPPHGHMVTVTNQTQVQQALDNLVKAAAALGTRLTDIPDTGLGYVRARSFFTESIPMLGELPSINPEQPRILRQDGYILEADGTIVCPDGSAATPGLVVGLGWVVARDRLMARY